MEDLREVALQRLNEKIDKEPPKIVCAICGNTECEVPPVNSLFDRLKLICTECGYIRTFDMKKLLRNDKI